MKPEAAVKVLNGLSFFKRIDSHDLKEMLPKLKLREGTKGECLFCEDKVLILLNGRVVLRSHD